MQKLQDRELTFQSLHRPLSYRLLNFCGSSLKKMGIPIAEIDVNSLLEGARKITNLSDFGDRSFHRPLSQLVESLKNEAHLNFVGQSVMRNMLTDLLSERLRVQYCLQQYPEILAEKIEKPLFIIGLPRSGTTFLFNSLCQDTNSLWLQHWELRLPAQRFLYAKQLDRSAEENILIEKCSKDLEDLKSLVPNLDTCHIFGVSAPEECFYLLNKGFVSPIFPLYANVPTYYEQMKSEWWGSDTQKMTNLYQYYCQQIQFIKNRRNRAVDPQIENHWVFKAPVHLMFAEQISTVFPNACFVHIHRDPLSAVPSGCSLIAMMRGALSDRVNFQDIGTQYLYQYSYAIKKALESRRKNPSLRIIDVHYDSLMENPVEVIREIYQKFDYAFTEEVEIGLKKYILEDEDSKNKRSKHRYSLEQFGLEPEDVYQSFAEYYDYLNSIR